MTDYWVQWSLSGWSVLQADSMDEVIAAVSRSPLHPDGLIEGGCDPVRIDPKSGVFIE